MFRILTIAVFCFFVLVSSHAQAQDCSNGKCQPARNAMAKVVKKMQDAKASFSENRKCRKFEWKAMRPKNWFPRVKRWRCCK